MHTHEYCQKHGEGGGGEEEGDASPQPAARLDYEPSTLHAGAALLLAAALARDHPKVETTFAN
jgi:hypothetical protein